MQCNTVHIVCSTIRRACYRLKPDGCTLAPDFNFVTCCDYHDACYRFALTTRKQADLLLRECIRENGHPIKAHIYYFAVRAFGWLFWQNYRSR